MLKNPIGENLNQYEEEIIPFDDAMRLLLQAKPQHREAQNQKAVKLPKKAKTKKGGKS